MGTVEYLRFTLDAPVRYSRSRRGYYYEDPTYALPAVFLRDGELLALSDGCWLQVTGCWLESWWVGRLAADVRCPLRPSTADSAFVPRMGCSGAGGRVRGCLSAAAGRVASSSVAVIASREKSRGGRGHLRS
jgi:hypothetical protein